MTDRELLKVLIEKAERNFQEIQEILIIKFPDIRETFEATKALQEARDRFHRAARLSERPLDATI
jgi:hypothetical protein